MEEKSQQIKQKFLELPLEKLVSGMFSDSLDKLGYRNQVITGLLNNNQQGKFFGVARTVQIEDIETDDENIRTGLSFLESLEQGEVLLVAGSMKFAYFGELMTRLSVRQKVGGVVIDGLTRDTSYTFKVKNLPIYAKGYSPVDIKGRGRVQEVDVKININGIEAQPSNLIFADHDGVVVIPDESLEGLYEKISACLEDEDDIIRRIDNNEPILEILNFHKEF